MYYPLSQIKTNLYTNGDEYALRSNNEPYSGYYWVTSKGTAFTGKTPQDTPTQELILITNFNSSTDSSSPDGSIYTELFLGSNDTIEYASIVPPYQQTKIPTYSLTLPTLQDYQIGEYRRLFCKKTNEIIYLEINVDTYNKLITQDSTIAYQYYQPFNIPWQLTGDKEQVSKTNRNIVELTMKQQKLPQFDLYLKKDYTKYYK
jgi:hypothetical protein